MSDDRRNVRANAKAEKARAKALRPFYRKKRWWLVGFIVLVVIIGALGSKKNTTTPSASSPTTTQASNSPSTGAPAAAPTVAPTTQAPKPTAPPGPVETAGQANARRSAEQYLSLGSGFSRTGLVDQLSSSFGAGFSLADATYGVDATRTDWNAQACLSAKNYLKLQPFSHAGLVQQLSSSFGAKFTPAEAEYGVACAGL